MATQSRESVFPVSHSAIEQYESCPYRYYRHRIAADVEDAPGEAATYGGLIHQQLECAVCSDCEIGPELESSRGLINSLRISASDPNAEVMCEHKLAVRRDFSPCLFTDEDAYFRGIIDLLVIRESERRATVVDYKTGKFKASTPQAPRNAFLVFCCWPKIETVRTLFIYLTSQQVVRRDYTRETIEQHMAPTFDAIREMEHSLASKDWPYKPSGLCGRYCAVKDCQFNGSNSRR